MNFISEFKNRIFFIFFVWIYFSLLCYYYKNILFFLVLKKLIFDQKIKIYFIYTNVTELFFIYLKLINFFNLQIMFSFFCYHFLIQTFESLFIFFSGGHLQDLSTTITKHFLRRKTDVKMQILDLVKPRMFAGTRDVRWDIFCE